MLYPCGGGRERISSCLPSSKFRNFVERRKERKCTFRADHPFSGTDVIMLPNALMGRSSLLRHNLNATLTSFQLSTTPPVLKLGKRKCWIHKGKGEWHSLVPTITIAYRILLQNGIIVYEIEEDIFEGANQCRSNLDIIYRCMAQNRTKKENSTFHGS